MIVPIHTPIVFVTESASELDCSNQATFAFCNETVSDTSKVDTSKLRIYKKVKQIIIDKLGVDEKEVTLSASFTNDLGADSLDIVELIMEFEKEFNISIPDSDVEKINTVGQVAAYVYNRVKNGSQKKKLSQ